MLVVSLAPSATLAQPPSADTVTEVYATRDGRDLLAEISGPADPGPLPTVVLVHGGGWSSGEPSSLDEIAAQLVADGWRTVRITYRLEPYPTQVEDVTDAVRWVAAHADELDVDPTRVSLLGASSGGNVALQAAARIPEEVAAVASLSGPTDLELMVADDVETERVRAYAGCESDDHCAEALRAASPVSVVEPWFPPTYQAFGTDERIPVDQGARLVEVLDEAGVTNELATVEGRAHGKNLFDPVRAELESFLSAAPDISRPDAPEPAADDAGPVPLLVVGAVTAGAAAVGLLWLRRRRQSP